MFGTRKGKYTVEENEKIIQAIHHGLAEGKRERDISRQLSEELTRGYTGILSQVRKLKAQYPLPLEKEGVVKVVEMHRLNSWGEEEEEILIQVVNQYTTEGKPLSSAIVTLEKQLDRTQAAIYQRIYALRRKCPERFSYLPAGRPRRKRPLPSWTMQPSNLYSTVAEDVMQTQVSISINPPPTPVESPTAEEEMILKKFEEKYGPSHPPTRQKLLSLMRIHGCIQVLVSLFTLNDDPYFSASVANLLEQKLQTR